MTQREGLEIIYRVPQIVQPITHQEEPLAEYDTIPKQLIRNDPQALVRLALGRDDVEVEEVLDTELPRVETRQTDILIRVRVDGKAAMVHIEFQTTDNANMPIRMASYIIRLIEQYGLPVYAFVIYLRPTAGRRDEGYYTQKLAGHRVFVEYKVFRLSEMDGQRILEGGHPGLLPFAPLMKRPLGMGSEEWLRECVRKSDEVSLDSADKANFFVNLAVLSGLAYEPATIKNILFQEGIMDAITRESSFAQYLEERGVERGIEQGIEQGIERGIERGGREHTIAAILDVLEIRFDPAVASQFAGRIAAIGDLQRLKQLHRAAVQVDDLDAFEHMLDADA